MKFYHFFIVFTFFAFMSCNTEELSNAEPTEQSIEAKGDSDATRKLKCPPPVVTLSPCDQKFKFFINRGIGGGPDYSTFEYKIWDPANMTSPIDIGFVSYGQYTTTTTSMQYCYEYIFEFNDWCWGWTQIMVYSDGCGNVWLC